MTEEVTPEAAPSVSPEPLLGHPSPPSAPSRLAAILSRAPGRRGQPALVRETAALQLEQRRADWAYSRTVVALDIAWNLVFAVVSVGILSATPRERPNVPVRLWIVGYALQSVLHVSLVLLEYRRRRRRRLEGDGGAGAGAGAGVGAGEGENGSGLTESLQFSIAKRIESLNTMVSFVWWVIGFYWVVAGGEILLQNAPMLYWLTVVLLAFDVLFAIFSLALACAIGIALCCCLPCIIAILYAVMGQEGASDADISILPRYKYVEHQEDGHKSTAEAGAMIPLVNNGGSTSAERVLLYEDALKLEDGHKSTAEAGAMIPLNNGGSPSTERVLLYDDAQCCICLASYEDGTELHVLPCNHHFHSTCIVKWLRINATCPLCKYNILKGNDCV